MKYVGAGTTPSSGPTSGIETWKRYVLGRWRGMDLGSFGVRNMRGSNQLSVHAVGRAWDWRYADPGPGRAASDEAISFAIANYETLGIQAVHDYVKCQIWRCDRSGRGPGWKTQKAGNGMGDPSAKWLHWEVHLDAPLHWNTVEELLTGAPKATHPPTDAPALPQPTLKRGDSGHASPSCSGSSTSGWAPTSPTTGGSEPTPRRPSRTGNVACNRSTRARSTGATDR